MEYRPENSRQHQGNCLQEMWQKSSRLRKKKNPIEIEMSTKDAIKKLQSKDIQEIEKHGRAQGETSIR